VVDASPAKHGLRMPSTDIPWPPLANFAARRPGAVLLFLPDLLAEIADEFPEVEAAGAHWVDVQTLGS
jgi:C-methyltransferase C-terminal domain